VPEPDFVFEHEERVRFEAALLEGIRQADAGELIDGDVVMAELRVDLDFLAELDASIVQPAAGELTAEDDVFDEAVKF
jgi:hypothetical protein